MYSLTFMYPQGEKNFNVDHFLNVHLPLGVHLTEKHFGIRPLKFVILAPTMAGDIADGSRRYGALSTVVFETEQDVMTFARLFEVEEAARMLSADFPYYTAGAPGILIAKYMELTDIDALFAAYKPS